MAVFAIPPGPPGLTAGRAARKIMWQFWSNLHSLRKRPLFDNHDCENHGERRTCHEVCRAGPRGDRPPARMAKRVATVEGQPEVGSLVTLDVSVYERAKLHPSFIALVVLKVEEGNKWNTELPDRDPSNCSNEVTHGRNDGINAPRTHY